MFSCTLLSKTHRYVQVLKRFLGNHFSMFSEYYHFSRNCGFLRIDSLSIHLLCGQSDSQLPFGVLHVKFCQETDIDVTSLFSQELHSSPFAELCSNYV